MTHTMPYHSATHCRSARSLSQSQTQSKTLARGERRCGLAFHARHANHQMRIARALARHRLGASRSCSRRLRADDSLGDLATVQVGRSRMIGFSRSVHAALCARSSRPRWPGECSLPCKGQPSEPRATASVGNTQQRGVIAIDGNQSRPAVHWDYRFGQGGCAAALSQCHEAGL